MPPCKEVQAAKYQTRKSPPFHAQDCKDMTKRGKDGNYISKPDVRGVYKWVKASTQTRKKCNTTTYTILTMATIPSRSKSTERWWKSVRAPMIQRTMIS